MIIGQGRMRDVIDVYTVLGAHPNEWGQLVDEVQVTRLGANVQVKSADRNLDYGLELDEQVITCLTRSRPNIKTGQRLTWRDNEYDIIGLYEDRLHKSMIITARLRR